MAEGPDLPVLTDTRLRLRHGNRIARVAPGDGAQTDGALLLALAADALAQRGRAQTGPETWLFVAVIGPDATAAPSIGTGPLVWTGLAELGPAGGGELTATPYPRSETLNGDPDTALRALKEDLAVIRVVGVALSVIGGTGGTEASASISSAALAREITALCAQAAPEATVLHVGPELAFPVAARGQPLFCRPGPWCRCARRGSLAPPSPQPLFSCSPLPLDCQSAARQYRHRRTGARCPRPHGFWGGCSAPWPTGGPGSLVGKEAMRAARWPGIYRPVMAWSRPAPTARAPCRS